MPSTDLEMTISDSINEAGENGVQECIPVPATVPPKCVHPFDCLCPPERVSLFFSLTSGGAVSTNSLQGHFPTS